MGKVYYYEQGKTLKQLFIVTLAENKNNSKTVIYLGETLCINHNGDIYIDLLGKAIYEFIHNSKREDFLDEKKYICGINPCFNDEIDNIIIDNDGLKQLAIKLNESHTYPNFDDSLGISLTKKGK